MLKLMKETLKEHPCCDSTTTHKRKFCPDAAKLPLIGSLSIISCVIQRLQFDSPTDKLVMLSLDYITAGGNRHPSAADWDDCTGLLAYGTDRNVALWSPLV